MKKAQSLFEPDLLLAASREAWLRLAPRYQLKNPVMFVVWVGSVLTTGLFVQALVGEGEAPPASSSPSLSGCGSPCCSPTSPRP